MRRVSEWAHSWIASWDGVPESDGVTRGNNMRTTSRARSDAVRQKEGCFSGSSTSDSGSRDANRLRASSEKSVGRVRRCDMSPRSSLSGRLTGDCLDLNMHSHKTASKLGGQ
jgi:hypothetical protein